MFRGVFPRMLEKHLTLENKWFTAILDWRPLFLRHYHNSRPHLSLDRNSPTPRDVEPPSQGEVISIPMVGGLHHRYSRAA